MNSKSQQIKITSGKLKGLTLQIPSSAITRPTKSIMRESFFNSIRTNLQDKIFIECFAGSGSMGITALSEGAKEAIFFEIDKNALEILNTNLKKTQKFDENIKYKIFHTNFFTADILKHCQNANLPANSVILYLDPPFCVRDGMQNVYEKCFSFLHLFSAMQEKSENFVEIIAMECMSELEMPQNIGIYKLERVKKFGKSKICQYNLSD